MGRIGDEIIQEIRDRVDIVDLVGRHLTLKRSGRNYVGLCPFHGEKTPSFNVNSDRQSYYCFGCQEGGTVFSFLMHMENLTFPEAVRTLGRECGVEVPEAGGGEQGASEAIYRANEVAQAAYRKALAEPGNPALAYLDARGINADTAEKFELGFAPDRWDTVVGALRAERIPAEVGVGAGLLAERKSSGHYDRLRGRLIFPIRDVRGRVVGFGGRAVGSDQEPKYLNTPETRVFRKREVLYGYPDALGPIRADERAVVVEGYTDRIALHRAGVECAVATCGTALTPDHVRDLRRRTREVVLLFDGDAAGQRALVKALEILLPDGLRVRAVELPAGDDPDSFYTREGADALRALVASAPAALESVIRRAAARGHSTPWEKADAVADVAALLSLVSGAVERGEFAAQLALAVGTEARHVEAAIAALRRGTDPRDAVPVQPRKRGPEDRISGQIVRSLIEFPELAARIPRDELAALFPAGPTGEIVSALLDDAPPHGASERATADVERVCERLGTEAATLLRELAAADGELDEKTAGQIVDDALRWLRKQRRRREGRALTQQLRDGGEDWRAVLEEKQRKRPPEDSNHPPTGVT